MDVMGTDQSTRTRVRNQMRAEAKFSADEKSNPGREGSPHSEYLGIVIRRDSPSGRPREGEAERIATRGSPGLIHPQRFSSHYEDFR